MQTAEVSAPSGPLGFYRRLRAEGRPHDRALQTTLHSFGGGSPSRRQEVERRVERVRLEIDSSDNMSGKD